MRLNKKDIQGLLEEKHNKYNRQKYVVFDPISIPHKYTVKEDIEVAAFFAATLAWGNRKSIIASCEKLMHLMDDTPSDFIRNFKEKELRPFKKFYYRTFNGVDCTYFLKAIQNIYKDHGGLEEVFKSGFETGNTKDAICYFRKIFFELPYPDRTSKHISNPESGSAAKRLNMFLRWMVRKDKRGFDFGIWNLQTELLCMPLDVHTGRVSRSLGLLKRKQNDWKAVEELTGNLKMFDSKDPVKYDFALFGLGAFEDF